LDFKTLFVVLVSVFVIQSVALAQTWRQNREEIGIRDWAVAGVAMSLGSLFSVIGLYDSGSDTGRAASLLAESLRDIGAVLGAGGWVFVWLGVRHFYRRPVAGYRPVLWFVLLFTPTLLGGLAFLQLPDWRVVCASAAIGGFALLTMFEFLKERRQNNPVLLLMVTMLSCTAVIWLLRALASLDHSGHVTRYAFVDELSLYDAVVASVTITVSMIVMTNERINQRLHEQATRDPLTGALNRRAFFEASAPLLAGLQRSPGRLALCLIDLDHFKRVNDEHGHAVGDLVLERFARMTQTALREGDLFARYGGEEFVVLLQDADKAHAASVMQRLRELGAGVEFGEGEQRTGVTFSAGICHAGGPVRVTLDALLEQADRAMYAAKQAGRDRVVDAERHFGDLAFGLGGE